DNIREVQPTAFLAVPRVWEKFYSSVMIALKDATPLEKWVYSKAIAVGYQIADCRLEGVEPSPLLKAKFQIAYWASLRNIRRVLG
ncbi:long-chain fatty acid--CoA ligase, partial [Enterobacter cloacae]|uniref:long-chain fatty acid--CoA ligase n=1 Tax=Enterobacter cloacae TaxID=550 RepID=UPI0013D13BE8